MIRLQRRHLSSTPLGPKRASKLPHGQRLSLAGIEKGEGEEVFIYDEIENHFQLDMSTIPGDRGSCSV